ncbi:hypothetical protein [Mesorhizobium sp. CAU 1741]|uniref:hypothetical protein n=1 Tax=Mesorhizobium sp. CAU 1741 TaxID=3140366 RepID=UPI00325A7DFB
MSVEDLIRYWGEFDVKGDPLVHPQDADQILNDPQVYEDETETPEGWMVASQLPGVHLGLLPTPYTGNLRKADIFILMLNPGLAAVDFYAERQQDYRDRLVRNIRQENLDEDAYPFFALDPRFCWSGAYKWWMGKLEKTIQAIARQRAIGFVDATQELARRLAVVELFPYHSKSFGMHRVLAELPSAVHARAATDGLAQLPDRLIIITRQVGAWDLADADHIVRYKNGQARGASLSPNSLGGQRIIERMTENLSLTSRGF